MFCSGTGYSIAASEWDIPQDMTGMATDLYEGLWKFFDTHSELQPRPLFITGESYAGGYQVQVSFGRSIYMSLPERDVSSNLYCP